MALEAGCGACVYCLPFGWGRGIRFPDRPAVNVNWNADELNLYRDDPRNANSDGRLRGARDARAMNAPHPVRVRCAFRSVGGGGSSLPPADHPPDLRERVEVGGVPALRNKFAFDGHAELQFCTIVMRTRLDEPSAAIRSILERTEYVEDA